MMHRAANRAASVKVKREVGARVTAFIPAIDFILICAHSGGDGFFRGGAIGPRRSGGNVALAVEAFAKLCVGAANVFVERVAAALFVATKIVAITCAGFPC